VQPAQPESVPEVCNAALPAVPDGQRAVDIEIRVTPGRIERWGFGVGIQAGQAVTFGTVTSFAEQQDAAQWDLHASVNLEHRNLFDRLIRARLEIRPRIIFQMPFLNFHPAEPLPFGFLATASLRWPAFIEPRTNFLFQLRYDLGPMPFTNFFRSELDGVTGLERRFFDGVVYGGLFLHANWFLPTDLQPVEPREELPQTAALWLEEVITVDLRDNPRSPTAGAYFAFASQQAVQPLGFWDFVRFTGEARGYIPLPLGIVIAARFEIGVMEVFGTSLDPRNVYQLAQLGPPSLHLRGGGASSNRGFLPGLLGDVEQVYVTEARSADAVRNGAPVTSRPVRISGGTRSWEASLEIRIPLTTSFGIALFGDAGDVDRNRLGDPDDAGQFRFDHPQLAFGFGLRYHTIIGPLRFDVAVRPDELQVIGVEDSRPAPCTATMGQNCRPESRIDLGFIRFPGAFHLTIGEAF
jgi:translocation and assembly module TamA